MEVLYEWMWVAEVTKLGQELGRTVGATQLLVTGPALVSFIAGRV